MAQDRPVTQVVVHSSRDNSALGTAGLIFSTLGWVTCGLLCPIGALLSILGLFSSGKKTHAIVGMVVGFPGMIFLFVIGFGIIGSATAMLGFGVAAVDQAQKAAQRMQDEQAKRRMEESATPPAMPAEELPTDESMAGGSIPVEDATKPAESEANPIDDATKPVIPATEQAKEETKVPELPPSSPVQPPVKERLIRKWASADQKFTVEAEYLSHDDTVVTLKRVDNDREIKVPIEKLCVDDKQFLFTLEK